MLKRTVEELTVTNTTEERPSLAGARQDLAFPARTVEPSCLVTRREPNQHPARVRNTILESRALSTRRLYALKWSVFSDWCSVRSHDPISCDVSHVLTYLQELLDKGRSPSTLKVYMAAIAANHSPEAGQYGMIGEHTVKSQRPRSVHDTKGLQERDESAKFMAQTGDPGAEEWSQWSLCSVTCGQGSQVRTRTCVSPYGSHCSGPLRESRVCNNTAACPVHGTWEEWSPWSLCSFTCGRGHRTRTRTCTPPQHGGRACEGPETQSKLCNIALCPVDGQWQEWSAWSDCSVTCANGTQQRKRQCSAAAHGGSECRGHWAESRECSNPDCTANGQWNAWAPWSGCSKSCDGGWQRRVRVCQGLAVTGQPCDGSGEEVRRCSEQRCPAPYEICPEDYAVSMLWRRTPSGELAFNRCPPNATGTTSRRCSLDHRGVAYWEQPSYARCIANEYRYLQQSVQGHLAKGQRNLAGDGMSQVTKVLLDLTQRRNFYAGDLLSSVEILRNVTDTFKRASYEPSSDDVQNFFQIISNLLEEENREKWEDAQQIYPGSVELMQVIEEFIHIVGLGMKDFHNAYLMTGNLVASIQRLPAVSVMTDINFPMKGRKGMVDWARNSEDKVVIPKGIFVPQTADRQDGGRDNVSDWTETQLNAWETSSWGSDRDTDSPVSKREDLGVETAILSFDRQKSSSEVYELSSKGATDFLDSTDTVNNFALHFKAAPQPQHPVPKIKSVLVGKVQDLFNQKYSKRMFK
ncbi:adhesion G protein-coupled receptor B3-like [Garra rufa]|uniref:adhesion G protein-coupled receptor B3-like n=1 Tax=Garra rufa TaxID=137080 RepID=UPI003CCE7E65